MASSNYPMRRRPARCALVLRDGRGPIVLLTVCTLGRRPILTSDDSVAVILTAWRRATAWLVGRYVILPDHIHLFCAPLDDDSQPLPQWVHFWKSFASRRWPRQEERPLWQADFWDTQLRSGDSYEARWEYVRGNPVRHGYCSAPEDWRYLGE